MFFDPRLEDSSSFIIDLDLCQVRLNHNAAFPWLLLIPRREEIVEIIDLSPSEQQLLIQEIAVASQILKELFHPDKLNVASLGNIVPQLHVHLIVRYKTDLAWPNPAWGTSSDYTAAACRQRTKQLQDAFQAFSQLRLS